MMRGFVSQAVAVAAVVVSLFAGQAAHAQTNSYSKGLAILDASLETGAKAVQWTKSTADHFKWRFDAVE